ncbi:hypothetical protein [Streptomyces sp. NBC_01508]|uniref:hypothetical protein n=1 Tax=Streptomyces sp. NBC_01508 TaxID=2903888 RepID=UPI003867D06B
MTTESEANKIWNGTATAVGASTRSAAAKVRRTTGTVAHRAKASSAGAASTATTTAATAWTAIKRRKAVSAGTAAGVLSLAGAAFALGRRTARAGRGPLTRLTGGRI